MSTAYKFSNPDGIYFVSFACVQWVDVFVRQKYSEVLIDSLCYCQKQKGLVIHAWCIMPSHVHLIISRSQTPTLSDIMRDFKKFTSDKILKMIMEESGESRKSWMMWLFGSAGKENPNNTHYQFWQQDNHPEELITNHFMEQKLNYLHFNPVVAGFVDKPMDFLLSSARDYAGIPGLIDNISFLL